MLNFLSLQPETLSIDINDSSLRMVKLKKTRKGFVPVSYNEVAINHGIVKEGIILDKQAVTLALMQAYNKPRGKKFGTKYAVISLPEEKSFSQIIQMPNMSREDLKMAVPFEAENYIPLAIDSVYLDFEVLSSSSHHASHADVLINVMPKSIVETYVSCVKLAGLIPCALEVESQAIVRALVKKEEKMLPVVFIDLGVATTTFIIYADQSIRFTCSLPISSQQITAAIADRLGISVSEAEELKINYGLAKIGRAKQSIEEAIHPILDDLVTQIKKYIRFYYDHRISQHVTKDSKIEKIVLCGGGANLKKLPAFLSRELRMSVVVGNPLINLAEQRAGSTALIPDFKILSLTTALGLALRAASDENTP